MSKVRVGFNGMGRIGKNVMRVIVSKLNDRFEIVAGNDLVPAADIAASLPKDAVYGRFPAAVEQTAANKIRVGDHELTIYAEMDAANVPWGDHGVDIVFECTGFYLTTEKASAHLKGGAKRVIVSAPCNDDTDTVVVGVNHDILSAEHKIVSNASCTTNCLAPMTRAVDMSFPVKAGLMSTTHAATATQKVADTFGGGKNRATLNNVIPASTGAAVAVGKVLPHLNGKLNGTALRVPTDTGSVVEAVYQIEGTPSKDELVAALVRQRRQHQRLHPARPGDHRERLLRVLPRLRRRAVLVDGVRQPAGGAGRRLRLPGQAHQLLRQRNGLQPPHGRTRPHLRRRLSTSAASGAARRLRGSAGI